MILRLCIFAPAAHVRAPFAMLQFCLVLPRQQKPGRVLTGCCFAAAHLRRQAILQATQCPKMRLRLIGAR